MTFGHLGENAENNSAGWRLPESPDKVIEEKRELNTEIPQLQTYTDGLKFLRCVLEEISPEAIKFKLSEIRPSPLYKVGGLPSRPQAPTLKGASQYSEVRTLRTKWGPCGSGWRCGEDPKVAEGIESSDFFIRGSSFSSLRRCAPSFFCRIAFFTLAGQDNADVP